MQTVFIFADATHDAYGKYLLLAVMGVLAVGFAVAPLILSAILAPKKPDTIGQKFVITWSVASVTCTQKTLYRFVNYPNIRE